MSSIASMIDWVSPPETKLLTSIAEAGQRLVHRHDAGEGLRDQHDQRDGVEPRLVDGEHHDRDGEAGEDEGERGRFAWARETGRN